MAKQKQAEECVLYVRVSTTRQAEDGVSIDAQIAKGKANAEFRNLLLPDENIFIDDGVEITSSKSEYPDFIFSAKSSIPTSSAPADLAWSASSPSAKTTTLIFFPFPFGSIAEPLTFCRGKTFDNSFSEKIIKNLDFKLTNNQNSIIDEINIDLKSNSKMFRILQGDVGSGKTIVALIAASNVILSKYQVVLMAPTEILAKQHFNLAKKIFKFTDIKIELLTSSIKKKEKKIIEKNLHNGEINFLIGTHSVFQKNIIYQNLGLVIIDEQHKFGVRQRIELSNKGGKNCDILLMSATPIPRTLVLAL